MNTAEAREIFNKFAGAMAYVAVENPDGGQGIGSAFHVGEGVFVTARHVVEGVRIREVRTTERTYVDLDPSAGEQVATYIAIGDQRRPVHRVEPCCLEIESGPFFHPIPGVDVAVFRVAEFDPRLPWVPLGSHLDDWLGQSDFVLAQAIVLGYPPIPLTNEPHLFAARAEINAQVALRGEEHIHFILSALPRGGFSGGLVVVEYGFVLGVITTSLLVNQAPSELGFFAALSVEPIYNCLAKHKLLPQCQAEGWDDLWNSDEELFQGPQVDGKSELLRVGLITASLGIFDDGQRFHLILGCDDNPTLLAAMIDQASERLAPLMPTKEEVRTGLVNMHVHGSTDDVRSKLANARKVARGLLLDAGYTRILSNCLDPID